MTTEIKVVLPNCEKIKRGQYVVRTQAGFRKALKHFVGNDHTEEFKRTLIKTVIGYPKSYPSYVTVSWYRDSLVAHCEHIDQFKKYVDKLQEIVSRHSRKP